MNNDQVHFPLRTMLERQYEFAKPRAEFLRAARLDFSQKLRAGAFGVNAASAVAWGTLFGSLGEGRLRALGVGLPLVVICLALFLFGAWLAGAALVAQHHDLIEMEGDAQVRALKYQNVLAILDRDPSGASDDFQVALAELQQTPFVRTAHDQLPIYLTSASCGCWGASALMIAASIVSKPFWDVVWPLFHN